MSGDRGGHKPRLMEREAYLQYSAGNINNNFLFICQFLEKEKRLQYLPK
jgi:hypothetical protein